MRIRSTSWLIVSYRPNDKLGFRCGWTIPSKTGIAAVRNKLKRISREVLKNLIAEHDLTLLNVDVNLVFLSHPDPLHYKKLTSSGLKNLISKALLKIQQNGLRVKTSSIEKPIS